MGRMRQELWNVREVQGESLERLNEIYASLTELLPRGPDSGGLYNRYNRNGYLASLLPRLVSKLRREIVLPLVHISADALPNRDQGTPPKGIIRIVSDVVFGCEKQKCGYLPPTKTRMDSAFGAYAGLNLRGFGIEGLPENEENLQKAASRFMHVLPVYCGEIPLKDDSIRQILGKLLNQEAFPWSSSKKGTTRSYGINVSTENIIILRPGSEPEQPSQLGQQGGENYKFCVVVNDTDAGLKKLTSEHEFHNLLDGYPMFVVINRKNGPDDDFGSIILGANHEYIDGVPAADLVSRLAENLGFKIPDFSELKLGESNSKAIEMLSSLASWEEGDWGNICKLDLAVISKEDTEKINSFCDFINCRLEQILGGGNRISKATLKQMLIAGLYLRGNESLGSGFLKFSQQAEVQLDHFPFLYTIDDLVKALDRKDKETVRKIRESLVDLKKGNIGFITRRIVGALPKNAVASLNHFLDKFGLQSLIAGRVMTSYIPWGLELKFDGNEERNRILHGFGFPALKLSQLVAVTICEGKDGMVIVVKSLPRGKEGEGQVDQVRTGANRRKQVCFC